MAGSMTFADGDLEIVKDGRKVLDPARPLTVLFPANAIELNDYAITFPDIWYGVIYGLYYTTASGIPGFPEVVTTGCVTWAGLVGQEWGPDKASPHNLPDIVIGTVPEDTDFLDVQINLTRTTEPSLIFDLPVRSNIPQGEWVRLPGPSCEIEGWASLRRLFEFVLEGTTVYLRRYQSVTENGSVARTSGSATQNTRWAYRQGPNAPQDHTKLASFGQKIDQDGPSSGDGNRRPPWESGSSDSCSISLASIDYTSVWTGDIIITPGRIGAA